MSSPVSSSTTTRSVVVVVVVASWAFSSSSLRNMLVFVWFRAVGHSTSKGKRATYSSTSQMVGRDGGTAANIFVENYWGFVRLKKGQAEV